MGATVPMAQRFGHFEIRPAQRQLLIDGAPATLGARAFDLLLTLAERRERVVSKAELLDLVWPRVVVEENNLQVHVSALRRLLGPQAIATVPGRGYRFTAPACDDANLQVTPAAAAAVPAAQASAPAAPAHNLPLADRALFGRGTDLAELAHALPRQRLLTVVGAGGIGKTRLALAAAHAAVDSGFFSAGAAWVELAPLADAGLLVPTIARALALPLEATAPAERQAQLAERLAGRCAGGPLLLVLDNCEHLVAAVAALAQALLDVAPSLHLLATSQEPLRLAAERVWRLGPLAVDGGEAAAADAAASDSAMGAAVCLFEERVRSLQPAFRLDARARADATEVCRRLDGIPLAIELAAARVPLLGVAGLRERLEKAAGDAAHPGARLRVLGSGSRDAPQRQQTLAAALEWSHALLNAHEQRVLRRLGVFAGGFGLGLLQGVAGDPGDDEWALLETLGTLADKSLVSVDPGSVPRYRLLESTRAFALDRLDAAGETAAIRERHAGAVGAWLDELDARRWAERTDQLEAQLAPELDNLRAALAWAAEAADDPARRRALVALAGSSAWLWKRVGFTPEGLRWCRLALTRVDPGTAPAVEARLLQGWATLAHLQDAEAELAALARAAELWDAAGNRLGRFTALVTAAKKRVWRYDHEATAAALREAEAAFDPAFPPPVQAPWLMARTYFLEAMGRPAEGQPLAEQQVALMRAWGDPGELDAALCELAENLFVQDKAAEVVAVRREVAARRRGRPDSGQNLGNLAAALTHLGHTDEALRVARDAVPLERACGRAGAMLDHWALLACQRGRLDAAALALAAADALVEATGFARERSEQRASDAARAWLGRELPPARLERLLVEGRTIGIDAALEGALGS